MASGGSQQSYAGTGAKPKAARSRPPKAPKPCPNPVFEEWLTEWKEEATLKDSKMKFVFGKALSSLKKYPLVLSSGKECIILENFGTTLCNMIDTRIGKEGLHVSRSDTTRLSDVIDVPSPVTGKSKSKKKGTTQGVDCGPLANNNNNSTEDSDVEEGAPKKTKATGRAKNNYIPAYRSGAYGILVAIFKKEQGMGYRGYMLKSELLREAQDYCDASFAKPDTQGSKYTAWNSMATLLNKGLVTREGNPAKFMLTPEGRDLSVKLLNVNLRNHNIPINGAAATAQDLASSDEDDENLQTSSQQPFTRFTLEPGQFEIILCVDNCETNGRGKKDEVIHELNKNGVPHQVTKLNIGDFVWVCRAVDSVPHNSQRRLTVTRKGQELVLPYVVERKRADDLAHSIRDGRFHEQKHRLEKCRLQSIYLMESYGFDDWGLAEGALTQALANTQITNNFLIQETGSIRDTCAYLTHMTRHLSKLYLSKRISNCSRDEYSSLKHSAQTYLLNFEDFNEFSNKAKNWTVTEMFAKHLLRLKGLSVERAQAIIEKYPTPHSLMLAYDECNTQKEKESLLAHMHFGNGGRTIGPAISKVIAKLYTSQVFSQS